MKVTRFSDNAILAISKCLTGMAAAAAFAAFPCISQAAPQATKPGTSVKPNETAPPMATWKVPENALFFLRQQNADWYKVPPGEHEWILAGPLSEKLFIALGPTDAWNAARRGNFESIYNKEQQKQFTQQVLADWRQAIRPQWLPPPEMVTVATLTTRHGAVRQVAHSAFQRQTYHGLYIGTLGGDFWLYIERPEPLPQGAKPLRPSDVLRDDLFQTAPLPEGGTAYPRLGCQSREFVRYRAFSPAGPYQHVRILLIHCRFPTQLDFDSFGYP